MHVCVWRAGQHLSQPPCCSRQHVRHTPTTYTHTHMHRRRLTWPSAPGSSGTASPRSSSSPWSALWVSNFWLDGALYDGSDGVSLWVSPIGRMYPVCFFFQQSVVSSCVRWWGEGRCVVQVLDGERSMGACM